MRAIAWMVVMAAFGGLAAAGPVDAAPQATGAKRPLLAGTTATFVPWVRDPVSTDTFTFSHVHAPANGTASAASSHTAVQYTPDATFTSGPDAFTYRATDQAGNFVKGTAHVLVYDSTALGICKRDGTVNSDGTIGVRPKANSCTFWASRQTRVDASGNAVTMDYFINWPSSSATPPKGVVMLVGGGDLDMALTGDPATGVAGSTGGGNFVIRIAQFIADAGYITVAIDRPSDQTSTAPVVDQYRVSVTHAVDILRVLQRINTQHLPLFLAGTSRGTISAVAANLIATGIAISSPITNNSLGSSSLYIGEPTVPNLLPSFVARPTHVMWHVSDGCAVTPPAGTQALAASLTPYTAVSTSSMSGGTPVTTADTNVSVDDIGPCEAYDYHGYFGVETTAAAAITAWLDGMVAAFGGTPPAAPSARAPVAAGGVRHLNLANITGNPTTVSYALSHTTSTLGGSVSISGSHVTYTAPPGVSNATDYFVYVATDGTGAVGAGVITIKIGP